MITKINITTYNIQYSMFNKSYLPYLNGKLIICRNAKFHIALNLSGIDITAPEDYISVSL